MLAELTEPMVATIKDAAGKLTGRHKRAFQDKVTLDYLDGSARRAETVLGWGREAVEKGLQQLRGLPEVPTITAYHDRGGIRGRRKTEGRLSRLPEKICSLVDPQSQAGPKFQSAFVYTRMTAASALLTITFGTSRETSDFVVDCLEQWWDQRRAFYPHVRKLAIHLDCGPQIASNRTQFIKRMVEFADRNNLEIELIYYPPYHSKYNPIERCWGILEMHWNGTLLDTVEKALQWAKSMTWKGTQPGVHFPNGVSAFKPKARQPIDNLSDTLVSLNGLARVG